MRAAAVRVVYETSHRRYTLPWKAIFLCAGRVLGASLKPCTVVFVDEKRIRSLNHRYRGIDNATNVLSFSDSREILLCMPVVLREASERNIRLRDWMIRLFVHGIVHLEGYRHDTRETRHRMEHLEQKIIDTFSELEREH